MNIQIVAAILTATILAVGLISPIYATGGGEILKLIKPMVDEALQDLESNNTEAGIERVKDIQNELKDSYEVEEDDD